jgi:heat shock protein HspQ
MSKYQIGDKVQYKVMPQFKTVIRKVIPLLNNGIERYAYIVYDGVNETIAYEHQLESAKGE